MNICAMELKQYPRFCADDTMLIKYRHIGQKRTRLYFGFKIAAINFQKLLNYNNSLDSCARKKETA